MSLQRNANNVTVPVDMQVFISFEDDPKIGKGTGLFGEGWHTVGMLAEGSSITQSLETNETEISAAHYGVLRTKRTPGAATAEFEVVEDNPITRKIAFPSETADGVRFHDGKRLDAHIAIVFVKDNDQVEIIASRYKAHLFMEEVANGEELEGKTVTVQFEKGPQNDYVDVHYFEIKEGTLVPVKPIRFVEDSEIKAANKIDVAGKLTGEDKEFPATDADKKVAGSAEAGAGSESVTPGSGNSEG